MLRASALGSSTHQNRGPGEERQDDDDEVHAGKDIVAALGEPDPTTGGDDIKHPTFTSHPARHKSRRHPTTIIHLLEGTTDSRIHCLLGQFHTGRLTPSPPPSANKAPTPSPFHYLRSNHERTPCRATLALLHHWGDRLTLTGSANTYHFLQSICKILK